MPFMRFRRTAAIGGLALAAFINSAAPAGASARIGAVTRAGDPTTESHLSAQGNVVYFSVSRTADVIMTGMDVAMFTDPATTPAWGGATGPTYLFDVNNDDYPDYVLDVWWDGGLTGAVYDYDSQAFVCSVGTRVNGDYHYQAWFDPGCIGDPTSMRAIAQMYWLGEVDQAPDEDWSNAWDRSGYSLIDADGRVYGFGNAPSGFPGMQRTPGRWFTDVEMNAAGDDYWALEDGGRVLGEPFWGSPPPMPVGEKAAAISGRRDDSGYWVFTSKGRVFPFGSASHFGDMAGRPLNGPIIASVATPSGRGYYLIGSDGGIFAYGDAKFRGSMGGKPLNKPVVGLVPDPDGVGYWLVASDGGVFAFEAGFRGSMGGKPMNKPVAGMVPYGNGYLMVGSDGGVFNFSDKPFSGSLGATPPSSPVVNIAPLP